MRAPACLLLTLAVAAPSPQPTPPPPPLGPGDNPASPFTNCMELDILEIEELRSKLMTEIDFDLNERKENVSFGLLEEDWSRLKQLQEKLPNNSILKTKLLKLFRLLISSLFLAHKPVKSSEQQTNYWERNNTNISRPALSPSKTDLPYTSSNSTFTKNFGVEVDVVASGSEQKETVLHPPYENPKPVIKKVTNVELPQGSSVIRSSDGDEVEGNTEDYQDLYSENNKDQADIKENNEKQKSKEIKFVEEYEKDLEPTTNVNIVSIVEIDTEINTAGDIKPTGSNIFTQETTTLHSLVSDRNTLTYGTSVAYEEVAGNSERTLENTTIHTISSDLTTENDERYSDEMLTTASSFDSTISFSTSNFTYETTANTIEDSKKELTTTDDGSENSSPSTLNVQQSSETSLSQDFPTTQPTYSRDGVSIYEPTDSYPSSWTCTGRVNIESTESSSDFSKVSLSTIYPTNHDDTKSEIKTQSSISSDEHISTSTINSRQDKYLHSTTSSPFSSSNSTKESFRSFTITFPRYPKLPSTTQRVKQLLIYPPDIGQNNIFPFEVPRRPPMLQTRCQGKSTCVRVQNVKFNNRNLKFNNFYNSGSYTKPKTGYDSKDSRTYNFKSNHKNWDSDSVQWFQKIRTLRKKEI